MKPSPSTVDFIASQVSKPGGRDWLEGAKESLRARAQTDFFWFLRWCCNFQDIENEYHIEFIHRWDVRRHVPYSIWLAPRKHLKTTIGTIGDTLFEAIQPTIPDLPFYQGRYCRQLISSATLSLVIDMLAEIRGITESSELFRFLYPEYCIDLAPRHVRETLRDRQDQMDWPCSGGRKKEASISVMAIDSSRTSKHFGIIRHDDVQNETNVESRDIRNTVYSRLMNTWQLRVDPTHSRIRITCTRWHHDDAAGREIQKEKERREAQRIRGEKVRPRCLIYVRRLLENGKPIWPERFTPEACRELQDQLPPYIFSCQYMNNPVAAGDAIFRREDIGLAWESEIQDERLTTVAALDLAVSDRERSDFTAIVVLSVNEYGRVWVRHIVNERTSDMDKVLHIVEALTKKYRVRLFGVEKFGFQASLNKEYRRRALSLGMRIPWVELPKSTRASKFSRWVNLQPVVRRGDFYIMQGIENQGILIDQMTSLTPDHLPDYDDALDALADAYQLSFQAPSAPEEEMPPDCAEAIFSRLYGPLHAPVSYAGPKIGSTRSQWYED